MAESCSPKAISMSIREHGSALLHPNMTAIGNVVDIESRQVEARVKRGKHTDWELIERDFRAGLKSLREIGAEHGITEGAVRKKAKANGWTRDLSAKIQQKAADIVRREEVRKEQVRSGGTQLTPADERTVVDANAQKVADVDLGNRADLRAVLDVQRTLAEELALLSLPEFADSLAKLGEIMDESYTTESGREVKDKVNETYHYIISLAGRVKMAKDIAGAYGVYVPLQRKIYSLDSEKKNSSELERLLDEVREEVAS
jgi:hypothetical protein